MLRAALSVALMISLLGCVTPPQPVAPAPLVSADHLGLGGAPVSAAAAWWTSFQDPQLNQLIEQALQDSPTLAQAQARLRTASAQAEIAHAATLPSAKLDASAFRQHAPENYLIPAPLAGGDFWMSQAGATLNWDLDFWGKQADAVKTATALTSGFFVGHRQHPLNVGRRGGSGLCGTIPLVCACRHRGPSRGATRAHHQDHPTPRRCRTRYASGTAPGREPITSSPRRSHAGRSRRAI